jgi:hypothetical protein
MPPLSIPQSQSISPAFREILRQHTTPLTFASPDLHSIQQERAVRAVITPEAMYCQQTSARRVYYANSQTGEDLVIEEALTQQILVLNDIDDKVISSVCVTFNTRTAQLRNFVLVELQTQEIDLKHYNISQPRPLNFRIRFPFTHIYALQLTSNTLKVMIWLICSKNSQINFRFPPIYEWQIDGNKPRNWIPPDNSSNPFRWQEMPELWSKVGKLHFEKCLTFTFPLQTDTSANLEVLKKASPFLRDAIQRGQAGDFISQWSSSLPSDVYDPVGRMPLATDPVVACAFARCVEKWWCELSPQNNQVEFLYRIRFLQSLAVSTIQARKAPRTLTR